MSTRATVEIDRARIAELTEREQRRLDERTPHSRAMYERARQDARGRCRLRLPAARAVADLPRARRGLEGLGRRRHRAGRLPQRLRLDGRRATRTRRSREAVEERLELGTHFAAPTEDAVVVAEELKRRWGLPAGGSSTPARRRRWTRSASRAPHTGRDTIVKIFGSYHGHHDYVMVSIGVPYDQIGDRESYESLPYGGGIPQSVADLTIAVPFNDAGAMERRIEQLFEEGRPPACVIMEPAMMNLGVDPPRAGLPGGGPRADGAHGRPADLRRGQDGSLHRGRRCDRALRRHARPGHAREGARRRPPDRRDRRHRGGVRDRRGRHRLPGRHLQREPAGDGRGAREPDRGAHARGVRADSRPARSGCCAAARR